MMRPDANNGLSSGFVKSRDTETFDDDPGPAYGRGTGVPDPVDVHVGSRIRTRRLLIGMNQDALAQALGLTFQQVQKYEGGANRVSASRLSQIAGILGVPIAYFFLGLETDPAGASEFNDPVIRERMQRPETIELIRAYYAVTDPEVRRQFLSMVRTVAQASGEAA